MAESVSRIRDPDRRSGADIGLPQDRATGFRSADDSLHAAEALPGIEIAEGVFVQLQEPGHLSGKYCEPGAGGCGEGLRPGVGRGEGPVSAARRNRHYGGGTLAATGGMSLVVVLHWLCSTRMAIFEKHRSLWR